LVIFLMKWDIRPGMEKDYASWAQTAVKRLLSVPGVIEFRAYRPITGCRQVAVTYEFGDMQAFEAWYSHEDTIQAFGDGTGYIVNRKTEIWGPSPVVPEPIRPGH